MTEELNLQISHDSFDAIQPDFGINDNLFIMGGDSIDIIKIKQKF